MNTIRLALLFSLLATLAACGPSSPDLTCTEVCTHNYPSGPAGALRSCLDDCAIEPRQP